MPTAHGAMLVAQVPPMQRVATGAQVPFGQGWHGVGGTGQSESTTQKPGGGGPPQPLP